MGWTVKREEKRKGGREEWKRRRKELCVLRLERIKSMDRGSFQL